MQPLSRVPGFRLLMLHKSPREVCFDTLAGKTWLIPHIREWLTKTKPKILAEPFAGGGIVSLTAVMEELVEKAIMVEIDHDVAAFWHAALRDGATLAKKIRHFTPTRERVRKLERQGACCVTDHGFRTLILNRTRKVGILAPGASYNKRGENGKGIRSRWYPDTLAARYKNCATLGYYVSDFPLKYSLRKSKTCCFCSSEADWTIAITLSHPVSSSQ